MLTVLLLTLSSVSMAQENPPIRPMRPLTYPVNPDLSEGNVDNFFSLYVDPENLSDEITPSESRSSGPAKLTIVNRTMAWQEIAISDTKIGVVGPLTTAVIHDVQPGVYDVSMTNSTGFTASTKVETTEEVPMITPGNTDANPSLESDFYNEGLPEQKADRIISYQLPSPPPPTPAPEEQP